jgi:hypothetical protein
MNRHHVGLGASVFALGMLGAVAVLAASGHTLGSLRPAMDGAFVIVGVIGIAEVAIMLHCRSVADE